MRFLVALLPALVFAQSMTLEEYEPKSSLVVPQNPRTRARFPFVDVHSHQNSNMSPERLDQLIKEMDAMNMRVMVNLSGGYGERLRNGIKNLNARYPGRFVLFANPDLSNLDSPDYPGRAARQLEEDVKAGAQGLKLFKGFSMSLKDSTGKRIPCNDPRFDKLFQAAAKHNLPVLFHVADPRQFWEPMDKYNERWYELKEVPNRKRDDNSPAPWQVLMDEAFALFKRHPNVKWIGPHLLWYGGDLAYLGRKMDELPNLHVDISAVLAELGRQPRFAKAWITKYQDRVLMGKDTYNAKEFETYFRVLETADEYFPYYRRRHAFWSMYGLDLPDDVLKKVYYKNALRLIPGMDTSRFPQ